MLVWSANCGGVDWKEDPQTGKCYKLIRPLVTFWECRDLCMEEGADVMSINSYEEQTFINGWFDNAASTAVCRHDSEKVQKKTTN